MSAMVEFLRARLDEDEAVARAATPGPWEAEGDDPTDDEVYTIHDGQHGDLVGGTVAFARGGREIDPGTQLANMRHIAHHNPARVLAEAAAKRERIRVWNGLRGLREGGGHEYDLAYGTASKSLQLDAAVYSEHPDYLKEWAP